MDHEHNESERLFSYGTLQTEAVQLSTFGRKLDGSPDALVGFRLQMIQITDQEFVATSGAEYHRNLEFTGSASDFVDGTVFSITSRKNSNNPTPMSLKVINGSGSNCVQALKRGFT